MTSPFAEAVLVASRSPAGSRWPARVLRVFGSWHVGRQHGQRKAEHRQLDFMEVRPLAFETLAKTRGRPVTLGHRFGRRGVGHSQHDGVHAVTVPVEELV